MKSKVLIEIVLIGSLLFGLRVAYADEVWVDSKYKKGAEWIEYMTLYSR